MAQMPNAAEGMGLAELLRPWLTVPDRPVSDVTLDSRGVRAGALFLALPGGSRHGIAFAGEALRRGAGAVLWDDAPMAEVDQVRRTADAQGALCLELNGLRQRAGEIAARFFGEPSRAVPVVGVTGTDGKTSVTQFLGQALTAAGRPCGILGTLGNGLHGTLATGTHTTPDAVQVQRLMADMVAAGAGAVAMEVSSHALDQHRVGGVAFDCAVLTNLSRDHLDYHGTEAAYAEAKAGLFTAAAPATAVLNADDAFGRSLVPRLPASTRCLRYSLDTGRDAELVARAVRQTPDGLTVQASVLGESVDLHMPLLGRFNAANVLATGAALLALGYDLGAVSEALADLRPVPGRMERYGGGSHAEVVIDYAHTPAALEAALQAMRAHFTGALWCVFGCGGDRDRGKRALMGRAAAANADHLVVTDDNPRTEDPERIIRDILAGAGESAVVERDRAAAIALALERAVPGDAVLVAGKGHEDYQIVGRERRHFSDRETVQGLIGGPA